MEHLVAIEKVWEWLFQLSVISTSAIRRFDIRNILFSLGLISCPVASVLYSKGRE
ncbi:hypothetical protein [Okeania sp. KiyG1]|uniref:hypothetical protein n=1 Tax=Okeania sp. KiyG1 TaxID=2720165 RepID=UPI001922EDE7|nr:hypothetical protein [Okeania sp. KiyG1]